MKKKLLGQERMKKLFNSLSLILLFTTLGWGQSAVFTTPTTTGTWLCPPGVTSVTVQCWGAGGAGGAATAAANRAGGGGGGGSYVTNTITVVPGTTYNITVGAGGTPNSNTSSGSYGKPGGKSEFSGGSVTTITASGGTGGSGGVPNQTFGIGGVLGGIYAYSHSGTASVQYTTAVTVPAPVGGGTTATAIGQLSGLGLNSVNPTSMGSGYTAADGTISLTLTGGTGQTVTTVLYNPDIDAGGTSTKGANGNAGVTGTNGGAGGAGGNGGAGAAANTTGSTVGTVGTAPGGGGSGGFTGSLTTAKSGGAGGAGKVELTWISAIPTILLNKTTLSGFNYDAGNGPSGTQNFTVSSVSLNAGVVVTPPANYEISTDNSTWTSNPSSITLPQTGGTLDGSPVTVYVRLKAGLPAANYDSEAISLTSTGATPVSVTCSGGVTEIFYYSGSGSLATVTNWGTATDGTGTNPTNFTTDYKKYVIRNTTAHTTDAAWTVSGTASKIIVGDATQAPLTLTIANGLAISGTMDITAANSGGNSVIIQGTFTTQPTFGLLDSNSEVHYEGTGTIGGSYTYGKLFIDGTGTINVGNTNPIVKTAITVATDKTLSFPQSNSTNYYITLNSGGSVTIDGTVILTKPEGFVDANIGTATSTKGAFQFLGTENLTLGVTSIINYNRGGFGAGQIISPKNYVNLIIAGSAGTKDIAIGTAVSGTLTLTTNGAATITGGANLTLGNGATIIRTSGSLNAAPSFAGIVNLVYNGAGAFTPSFEMPANGSVLNNLTVSGTAALTLSATNTTVNNDLTVTTGSLTQSAGNLTVKNILTNNAVATAVVIENNANLIQVNNVANVGDITVKRNSNSLKRLDYSMWSSPVVGTQTLSGFSPLTSQAPNNRFYTYDPTSNLYVSATPTVPFSTGTGYLIRMPNEDPANLGTGSNYYLGIDPITYNGVFTGQANNGTVTLNSLASDKYYSVGNPYPSTISADAFINGNATDGTLYFWRKTNGASGTAYATYTLLGGAGTDAGNGGLGNPNGTIQVGQGFIVKTGLPATSLAFTNTMREGTSSTQFFRTKQVAVKDRVWLNLTNPTGAFSQALVGYMAGATLGVDNGIDGKYINDSPIALTSNINNEEYVIQGRPTFDPSDVVGLNFKTDVAGDYTIALDHFDGLFAAGQDVYLLDTKTGIETDLKATAYTFPATAGTENTRFSLKYQKTLKVDASAFNENSVTVYKNKGTLYVNSGAKAINNIKVFDIQGRLIAEQKNIKATSATMNNLKANNQVLIVIVTGLDNQVVTKKVAN